MNPNIEGLLRPLSARSLIASALLGSHPPELPGRLLVAMARRFGIAEGTARVALSRMVERGELVRADGTYGLGTGLLERQARQDANRSDTAGRWYGGWEQAVITAVGRSSGDRARLRRALTTLGLGEWREGVWMRPANLDPDRQPSARAATEGEVVWLQVAALDTEAARRLAATVFDLDDWTRTASALTAAVTHTQRRLDADPDAVVTGFNLASAALRHLTHDPRLPPVLTPKDWPAASLRTAYADFEAAYQRHLRAFFRDQ